MPNWKQILQEYVDTLETLVGTAGDNADLNTLFAKFEQQYVVDHAHILLIVADATSLDADMDTALKDELEDDGYIVDVAEPADIAGNIHLAFDFIVVSGSITADTNLTKLREAECPVLCHSAEVAVSTNVFSLGLTAGTEAAQTHIEIVDNTPVWLLDTALGDLEVTASAELETMASVSGDVISLAEEKEATGNDITMAILRGGDADGQGVIPNYDRVFVGVKDYTNANAAFKALMALLWEHLIHERRVAEVVVTPKRVYQEAIPDTDFDLALIDDALTADPPSADAENSIVDLDQRTNQTRVLRSLWVNTTSFGTTDGTKLTYALWVLLNGTVTKVDEVEVSALGIQNLMDLFGLPEVHADGIWITVVTDATDEPGDAACEGSYRYAEARK